MAPRNAGRIAEASDIVRFELAEAHRQGKPIMPVVIDEQAPPLKQDLPADLQFLPALHFGRLSATDSLDRQSSRLIMNIRKAVFGRTTSRKRCGSRCWPPPWSGCCVRRAWLALSKTPSRARCRR